MFMGVYHNETTLSGRGHKACGKSKLMDPAGEGVVGGKRETCLEKPRE